MGLLWVISSADHDSFCYCVLLVFLSEFLKIILFLIISIFSIWIEQFLVFDEFFWILADPWDCLRRLVRGLGDVRSLSSLYPDSTFSLMLIFDYFVRFSSIF